MKKRKASEEEIISSSVAALLESDRKYVTIDWQKGERKKQNKSKPAKQVENLPQGGKAQQKGNGLDNWRRPEDLFLIEEFTSFGDFELDPQILRAVQFTSPRRVQLRSIPAIISGCDVLMGSDSATGKTTACILGVLHRLMTMKPRLTREDGTQVVVLCRDLSKCEALYKAWWSVMKTTCWWLTCSIFAGGENRNHEKARLRKGVSVMITTETRLLDHLENTSSFKVDSLKFFVVNNAAELLISKRGGKMRRTNQLLQEMNQTFNQSRIQNILCTSALHPELSFLAVCMLRDPVCIGCHPTRSTSNRWSIQKAEDWELGEK